MVQQCAGDDEVVATLFDDILKDIDTADFKTRHLQLRDISQIDVARHHLASGRHPLSQGSRDRPVATAKLQAAPAWTHAKPRKASQFEWIQ